MFINWLHLPI